MGCWAALRVVSYRKCTLRVKDVFAFKC